MNRFVRFAAAFTALLMLASAVACGKTETATETAEAPQKKVITATAAEIEAKIRKAVGDGYIPTVPIDRENLPYAFDLDMTKVLDFAAYESNMTAVFLDSVLVLKVEDGYVNDAVAAVNARYEGFVVYSSLYSFDADKVKNARLYAYDNYVVFVMTAPEYTGPDPDALTPFVEGVYAKIDGVIASIFGELPENRIVSPNSDR